MCSFLFGCLFIYLFVLTSRMKTQTIVKTDILANIVFIYFASKSYIYA